MLCLRQQICRNTFRRCPRIRYDQNLTWSGNHIDIHLPKYQLLRSRNIHISRSDDFIHRCNALRAIGQCRNSLCAANLIDFIHAGNACRRGNVGMQTAVLCRRGNHDNALDTRNTGRNRIHQHTAGILGTPSRHIDADAIQGKHALSQIDA